MTGRITDVLFTEAGLVAGLLFAACVGLVWALRALWQRHVALQIEHQRVLEVQAEVTRDFTGAVERLRSTVAEQGKVIDMIGHDAMAGRNRA